MTMQQHFDFSKLEFNLGDRLRKALEIADLTAIDMATYLDISKFTISRYINGKVPVPLQTLRLWSLRTGVPLEWLQTGKTPTSDPDGGNTVGPVGLEPTTYGLRIRRVLHGVRAA
ncbi:helix-turn-helix domain-containing protein [Corynebacterium freiburgense]|uniref:helix-turn-helix domain-containing protein n=1 Tax=Corynebacterium freiburgense TaxID=556548 RepID=UPI0025B5859B|nr:helix-turn-helix transcriptional regulator [Corynebacterium freiburgense]WJZ04004.1 Helix-turn-helix domain protein [Corynebacterium freiburgense]